MFQNKLHIQLFFYENANDVWNELHERLSEIDRVHSATLDSSINNLKQNSRPSLECFLKLKV